MPLVALLPAVVLGAASVAVWWRRGPGPAALLLVLAAACATVATTPIQQTVTAAIGGEGCTPTCEVVAGGWPLAWISDHPGLSPSGSVFPMGAVTGVDRFHPLGFLIDTLLFGAVLAALGWGARAWRGPDGREPEIG